MLCEAIVAQEMPLWVLILERIGITTAICVFILAVIWRLIPNMQKWLVSQSRQSDSFAKAAPEITEGLKDLVHHAKRIANHVTRDTDGRPHLEAE